MNDQEPPQGSYDSSGQWQPGIHDANGIWHGGFYDQNQQWQPGFYGTGNQWHGGFYDDAGTWHSGFRTADGAWTVSDSPAQQPANPKKPRGRRARAAMASALTILLLGAGASVWHFFFRDGSDAAPAATDAPASESGEGATGSPGTEGEEPPDENETEDTAPAALDAGFFSEDPDQFSVVSSGDANSAEVVTTVGTLTLETSFVDEAEVDGEPAQAADREELRLVEWDFTPGDREVHPTWGSAEVRTSDQTHSLGSLEYSEASGEFLVSAGDDAAFVVEAHGVEQMVSLATGERHQELPAAGFYRDSWSMEPAQSFTMAPQSISGGGNSTTVSAAFTLDEAQVTTYEQFTQDPQHWPEPGYIWVVLDLSIQMTGDASSFDFNGGQWDVTVSADGDYSVTDTYESQAGGEYGWPNGSYTAAFQVPLDTDEISIDAELRPVFEASGSGWERPQPVFEATNPITLEFPHELSD